MADLAAAAPPLRVPVGLAAAVPPSRALATSGLPEALQLVDLPRVRSEPAVIALLSGAAIASIADSFEIGLHLSTRRSAIAMIVIGASRLRGVGVGDISATDAGSEPPAASASD
jgi:hypothetical protein